MSDEAEIRYWKAVALYLADCHAATAESLCSKKSTSQYEKGRHRDICRNAAGLIRDGGAPAVRLSTYMGTTGRSEAVVVERLLGASK